jgi:soluble lytic murein transglycosylase
MKFRLILVGLFLSTTLFAQSNDSAFLTARDAFRAGDLNKLERATSQLGNHELAPYAESYRLRMWIDKGDPADMRDFLQRNEGSYVAEKLRADWIRWLEACDGPMWMPNSQAALTRTGCHLLQPAGPPRPQ